MAKKKITDYFLYKKRYLISTVGLVLLLIAILLITGLYAPGGLAQTEIDATVESHKLGFGNLFEPENIVNLPFKLAQKISFGVFGLSNLSIKLPSLMITAVAAICLFILISTWTDRRSAILSTTIILISGRWLFISQLGTGLATSIGLSIILVTALAHLSNRANNIHQAHKYTTWQKATLVGWLLVIFAVTGLLFYFKMGLYLVFIISLTMLLHPFVRLSLKRLNKLIGVHWYFVGIFLLATILTPLIIGIFKNTTLIATLLNVNAFNFRIIDNIQFFIKEFLDFSTAQDSLLATPWFNLSAIVLIVIGIFRETRTSYKPRSSIILMWLISALTIGLFSKDASLIIFVPFALSLAMGLDYVTTSWYRIFPRNPVARFVGLIPIVALIASLTIYNIRAYTDTYLYQPGLADSFSIDLKLIKNYLRRNPDEEVVLISSLQNNEIKFYEILALQNENLTVANKFQSDLENKRQIATNLSRDPLNDSDIKMIVTSHIKDNSDRFYVYKKPTD